MTDRLPPSTLRLGLPSGSLQSSTVDLFGRAGYRVSIADRTFILTENQSTYIPVGNTHRLENAGKLPLELIEVQSGSYLGEDDIVRFSDAYGRIEPTPSDHATEQETSQGIQATAATTG